MPLLPVINERTDFDLEVTLLDKDGDPLVPTTAFYNIHDVTNDVEVKDWTAFSVDALGVGTIEVLANYLDIADDENEYETRVITVHGTYGSDKEFAEEYRFRLKNLTVIPKT